VVFLVSQKLYLSYCMMHFVDIFGYKYTKSINIMIGMGSKFPIGYIIHSLCLFDTSYIIIIINLSIRISVGWKHCSISNPFVVHSLITWFACSSFLTLLLYVGNIITRRMLLQAAHSDFIAYLFHLNLLIFHQFCIRWSLVSLYAYSFHLSDSVYECQWFFFGDLLTCYTQQSYTL
jgi:hypothetical protein